MSDFIEAEWFGRENKIGVVLTYDGHDGFKARMAPLPAIFGLAETAEEDDIGWLMENAAKVPFEWAWGIFGRRMRSEWTRRHLKDRGWTTLRYDGQDYNVETLKWVGNAEVRECVCMKCGSEYPVWFAPNDLWNQVMRWPDGREGSEKYPFVCLNCFAKRAEELGIKPSAWCLATEVQK